MKYIEDAKHRVKIASKRGDVAYLARKVEREILQNGKPSKKTLERLEKAQALLHDLEKGAWL